MYAPGMTSGSLHVLIRLSAATQHGTARHSIVQNTANVIVLPHQYKKMSDGLENSAEGAPALGGWLAGSSPDASSSLAAFHSRLAGNAPVQ